MKRYRLFALLGVTLCLTGCFSLSKANVPTDPSAEHVLAENFGWYLLNVVPMTGNAAEDGRFPFVFRDDVTMDKVQRRVASYAASRGKTMTDLVYHNTDDVITMLFGIPVPYLLTYREVQVSGVLK